MSARTLHACEVDTAAPPDFQIERCGKPATVRHAEFNGKDYWLCAEHSALIDGMKIGPCDDGPQAFSWEPIVPGCGCEQSPCEHSAPKAAAGRDGWVAVARQLADALDTATDALDAAHLRLRAKELHEGDFDALRQINAARSNARRRLAAFRALDQQAGG